MEYSFIREKVIHCGKQYIAPEIYPYTTTQQRTVERKRKEKTNVSSPKQKNLNDKRAKRYFIQLANANFGDGDLVAHLTYAPEHLPMTEADAKECVGKFLRRLDYKRKKRGLPPLKYLCVTQFGRKRNGTHRIHHHIILNAGLERDEIEEMWWKEKKTKKRAAVMYGWANVDRLKANKKGIANMAGYMMQETAGKKHWTQSQNLVKPYYKGVNDKRYSKRQMEKIAKLPEDSEAYKTFWEKKYKGYELVDSERVYVDMVGWYFYLTMRKIN